MAFTAREVVMTFRGQNYLSGAIRRVGRDVGSLSRVSALSQQRAAAAIATSRARNSLTAARAEQAALSQTGSRALALENRRQQLGINDQRRVERINSLYQERLRVQRAQILNEEEINRLYEAHSKGVPFVGLGTNRIATNEAIAASELEYQRLQERMQSLIATEETQLAVMEKSSVEAQKLAADYAEQAARLSALMEIERTRIASLEKTALVESRLAYQEERILPVQQWQDRARAIEHTGRVVQMFGLIAAASFGFAAEQAAKFQTQATLAATQAITPSRNSVRQIHQTGQFISKQLLDLMASGTSVGSGAELNQSAYTVLSGVTSLSGNSINRAKQTIALVKEFNQVTKANYGLVSFDQVTQAGVTILNTFGTRVRNLPHEFDVMQNAVNRGRVTLGQFTEGLNQTAQPAKAAGYTFDQMAATLSFLSTKFPSYNRAAVGYARLVELLANPKLIAGLRGVGVTITDTTGKHLLPFDQVIARIVKRFPDLQKGGLAVQNFFKTFSGQSGYIGARRAFTASIQDLPGLQHYTRMIPESARGLVNASATALSQTGEVKWKELTTAMRALVIEIGQGAIPAFQRLAKPIEAALQWFNHLSPSTQRLVGYIGTLVSVGALLVGTLAAIGGGLASMVATFMLRRRTRAIENMLELRGAAIRTEASLGGLAGEAGAIGVRLALGLGIPAAIALLIIYHKQVGEVVHALGGLQAVIESLAVGTGVFFIAKWIPQLIRMITELRAAVSVMRAMRAAAVTAAAAETAIGAASVAAAGEVGILEGALVALFSPEILAGLAAVAAALLIIKGSKSALDRPANQARKTYTQVLTDKKGNLFEQTRTSERGPGAGRIRPITQKEAEGLGLSVNHPANAINNAIKDSPRYQHAIGANQKAVNAFNKELEREARLVNQVRVRHAIAQIQRQPSLVSSIESIRRLKIAAEQSPDLNVASRRWNAYYNALNALITGKTKAQQQAIRQLLKATPIPAAIRDLTPTDMIARVERAAKLAAAHPNDLKTQIAYEKVQQELNDKYKNQPALLAAINDVLGNFNTNIKDTTKSANTLGTTFQDVLSGIQGMYQNFKSTETGLFGDLFNGPFVNNPLTQDRLQWGGRLTGRDLLKDLHSQVSNFNHFHNRIDSLRRRGAPQELINQLMAAGDSTQNMQNLAALQSLNPHQLQEYFRTFNQGQRLIQQQTMRDLNNQLKIYRRHGRNIALAIITGIRDENVGVTNALTAMIKKMFPGLPVGATGAGGRATHHPEKQPIVVKSPDVHIHPNHTDENKPAISKKARQRHEHIRKNSGYAGPYGGPR